MSKWNTLDYADVMAEMEADQELAMEGDSITGMIRMRSLANGVEDDASQSDGSDVPPTQASAKIAVEKSEDKAEVTESTGKFKTPKGKTVKKRSVEVMRLPAPRTRTRKKLKQGWSTPQPRHAVVLTASELKATMSEVVHWASYHQDVAKVSNVLDQYPVIMTDKFFQARPVICGIATESDACGQSQQHVFVIPEPPLKKAEASMNQKRAELFTIRKSAPWGLTVSKGKGVVVLHEFVSFMLLPFLSNSTLTVLADDVVKKYSMLSLMKELKTKSGRSLVKFREVVSGVLRCGMLNDAVIDMGVTMIAESVQGCVAFSSLSMVGGWPTSPRQWLSETPYIIVPLHLSTNHWGVIIVEIGFPTTLKVYFYEPLHQE
ncbi:unnamed protein product [Phytophthora fragariaefolia]|uniref:Unnamed protein product n=1 Tax=Phytophthora fragariaefolia TaxID=1490495 RepID=A0A9W6U6X3_9STRA|nr:unnamed protein product [Phytophthora fragariaefolia]